MIDNDTSEKIRSSISFKERSQIEFTEYKGEFWKPCPGTSAPYLCCGYQILTPATGCGMYCRYCVLQAYLDHDHQTVYNNFSDLESEVHQKMASRTGVIRFGTGEFGDSLFLDHLTSFSIRISALLEFYNAVVEFKTKSINIGNLHKIKNPTKVIIGFSLNASSRIQLLEKKTAPLTERLKAAKKCVDMGFSVAFHFDPMFWFDNCLNEYKEVVNQIVDSIKDPSKIAWVSLGGFRSMPSLKPLLKKSGTHLPLFSGEMINGADGKLRYFRPFRISLYKSMREEFDRVAPGLTLYLCMESPEVWEQCGLINRIPFGLIRYLDMRAECILNGNL